LSAENKKLGQFYGRRGKRYSGLSILARDYAQEAGETVFDDWILDADAVVVQDGGGSFAFDDIANDALGFADVDQATLHQWADNPVEAVSAPVDDGTQSFAFDADGISGNAGIEDDALHTWADSPFAEQAPDDAAQSFAFDADGFDSDADAQAALHLWNDVPIEDAPLLDVDGSFKFHDHAEFDGQDAFDTAALHQWADQAIDVAQDDAVGSDWDAAAAHQEGDSSDLAALHVWGDSSVEDAPQDAPQSFNFDGDAQRQQGDDADLASIHAWADQAVADVVAVDAGVDSFAFDDHADYDSSREDQASIHAWADQAIADLLPPEPEAPQPGGHFWMPPSAVREIERHIRQQASRQQGEDRRVANEAKRRKLIRELFEKLEGRETTSEQAREIADRAGALIERPLIGGEVMIALNAGKLLLDMQAVQALLALYLAAQAQLAQEEEDLAILLLMG
jgi:hypothetical protein